MTETTRMTFGDMFRNSFLNMFPETIDPWSLVTVLAVSLLLGLGIFLVSSGWCTTIPSTFLWWS